MLQTAPKTANGAPQLPDFPFIQPRDESMGCMAGRRSSREKGKQRADGIAGSVAGSAGANASAGGRSTPLTTTTRVTTPTPPPFKPQYSHAHSLSAGSSISAADSLFSGSGSMRRPRIPAANAHQSKSSPRLDASRHPGLARRAGNGHDRATPTPTPTPTTARHIRFLSESKAGSSSTTPPALPPALIPAEDDEMHVVLAAARQVHKRNRSAGNLLLDGRASRASTSATATSAIARSLDSPNTSRLGGAAVAPVARNMYDSSANRSNAPVARSIDHSNANSDKLGGVGAPDTEPHVVVGNDSVKDAPNSATHSPASPKTWRSVPNLRPDGGKTAVMATPNAHAEPPSPASSAFTFPQQHNVVAAGPIGDSPVHPRSVVASSAHASRPSFAFALQRARTWSRSRKQSQGGGGHEDGRFDDQVFDPARRQTARNQMRGHSQSLDLLTRSTASGRGNSNIQSHTPTPPSPASRLKDLPLVPAAADEEEVHEVTSCAPGVPRVAGIGKLWCATKSRMHRGGANAHDGNAHDGNARDDALSSSVNSGNNNTSFSSPHGAASSSLPRLHASQSQPQLADHHRTATSAASTATAIERRAATPRTRNVSSPSSTTPPPPSDYGSRRRNKTLKGRLQFSPHARDTYVFVPDADESTLPARTTSADTAFTVQSVKRGDEAWVPLVVMKKPEGAEGAASETPASAASASVYSSEFEPEEWHVNTNSAQTPSPLVQSDQWRWRPRPRPRNESPVDAMSGFNDALNADERTTLTRSDSDLRAQFQQLARQHGGGGDGDSEGDGPSEDTRLSPPAQPHRSGSSSFNLGELLAAHRKQRESASSSYAGDEEATRQWQAVGGEQHDITTPLDERHSLRRVSFAPSATSELNRLGKSSFFYASGGEGNETSTAAKSSSLSSTAPPLASPATPTSASSHSTESHDVMWENSRPSSEFFSSSSVRRLRGSTMAGEGAAAAAAVAIGMPELPNIHTAHSSNADLSTLPPSQPSGSFLPSMASSETVSGQSERPLPQPFKFPRPPIDGEGDGDDRRDVTPTSRIPPSTSAASVVPAMPRVNIPHNHASHAHPAHHKHHGSNPSISSTSSVGTNATRFGFASIGGGGGGGDGTASSSGGSTDQRHSRTLVLGTGGYCSTATTPRTPHSQHKPSASTSSMNSTGSATSTTAARKPYMHGPSWIASPSPSSSSSSNGSIDGGEAQIKGPFWDTAPAQPGQTVPRHPYAYVYAPQQEHSTVRVAVSGDEGGGASNGADEEVNEDHSPVPAPPLAVFKNGHRRLKNSIDLLERAAMGTIEEGGRGGVGGSPASHSVDVAHVSGGAVVGGGGEYEGEAGQFEDAVER